MFVHVLRPKLNYLTLSNEPTYEVVVVRNKRMLVHRLVAAAFLGERPKEKIVHHKDHNKRNNQPKNLEYVTPSQNTKMAYAEGHINKTLKLTAFARKKIAEMYEKDALSSDLAKQFGVSKGTIMLCARRAGLKPHRFRKLNSKIYAEIRSKWVPHKYSMARLAKEYAISEGMVEYILGKRKKRGGEDIKREPLASGLYKIRTINHPQESQ